MTEELKQMLIKAANLHNPHDWKQVSYCMNIYDGISLTPNQWKTKYRSITGLAHKARAEKRRDAKTEISTNKQPEKNEIMQKDAEKPEKIEVVQNFEPTEHSAIWKGNLKIRFGLMGDTHINSKFTQLTYLHQFYDECKKAGDNACVPHRRH